MNYPKDVREMRQIILKAARGYERMDGEDVGQRISTVAHVIKSVLTMGEYQGLSGEDTMTVLAYHALCSLEKTNDQMIDWVNISPTPHIILAEAVSGSLRK